MKRKFWLLVPVLLLVVLVVVVAAEIPEEETLPADVQALVEHYIAAVYPFNDAKVEGWSRARQPWNFEPEMSRIAYGASLHFQTDAGPTQTVRANLSTLPYPPQQVWCARLNDSPDVVYVGLHLDLYNADLVIHTAAGDSRAELLKQLQAIDCVLQLP